MTEILILLVLFQLKHFLCDFPLQGKYMLGKFKQTGWVPPLAAHASLHALGTLLIAGWFGYSTIPFGTAVVCALADFAIHFTVDRVKASPSMLGRWKPDNKFFWWALGADQSAHHLTHYAIIAALVGAV
jgi:hypothetical protein